MQAKSINHTVQTVVMYIGSGNVLYHPNNYGTNRALRFSVSLVQELLNRCTLSGHQVEFLSLYVNDKYPIMHR